MQVDVIKLQDKTQRTQSSYAIELCVAALRDHADVHMPPDVFGSAVIPEARNRSLSSIRKNSDFVLFIDDDMVPVPEAAVQLLDAGRPVVSAYCTTRSLPPRIAARTYDPKDGTYRAITSLPPNRVLTGPFSVGFGFLMMHRSVLRVVSDFVANAEDWAYLYRKQHDRMKVRAEHRERERLSIAEMREAVVKAGGTLPIFQTPLDPDTGQLVGEDAHFCRLLTALDIPIAIDTGCIVGHIGDFPFSPLQLGITSNFDVDVKGDAA